MATVIFIIAILVTIFFIFRGCHRAAWDSIAGYKKVNGEMVQVAQPDHYTASGVLFAYWTLAGVISISFYLCVAFVLDASGLSARLGIQTFFACIKAMFN